MNDGRIYVVSGLPRSGTSMMMRMLACGGIPPLTDSVREPDADNPNGYYEFEDVKSIEADSTWLDRATGIAFKMVSALLPKLPKDRRYHVIFMRRDLDEILASQKAMLVRSGKRIEETDQLQMKRYFVSHLREVVSWLVQTRFINVTFVNYRDVLDHTEIVARSLAEFTGVELDIEKMIAVVDPRLYRQRNNGRSTGGAVSPQPASHAAGSSNSGS